MLKKDWKKNLLRVKQRADQGLGRAEKTEVLSEELLTLEKRVEVIRQVYHNTHKKLGLCLQTTGVDPEKRLKKMPESGLAGTLAESALSLGMETLLGQMFQLCGNAINTYAKDVLQYEMDVDRNVLNPIQAFLETDIPAIQKQRKHLNNLTIDRDVARGRYQSFNKQNNSGNASAAKKDTIRDDLEESEHRVEQCRDQYSTEMYAFLARESEYSSLLLEFVKSQVQFHKRSLDTLERLLPQMEEQIGHSTHSPVYGVPLEEHLRRSNRDIAAVLEDCICTLFEVAMEEEGLFRVAGTSSKVKKLKAAFDYGMVEMSEHVRDIHCVADALKLYLRELPEPLMTYRLYSEWMHAAHQPQDQRLQALWVVLNKLPRENYNNLRYLIKFLSKLAEKEDVNKMSSSNIAIVMGPNLMWAPPEEGGPSVLNTSVTSAIVELLVIHADWFFVDDVDFSGPSSLSQTSSSSLTQPSYDNPIASNGSGTAQPSSLEIQPSTPNSLGAANDQMSSSGLCSSGMSGSFKSITPPDSLSSSQDNLLIGGSPESPSGGGASPRAPRRGKKPAPLPPPTYNTSQRSASPSQTQGSFSEKPAVAEKPQLFPSVSTTSSSSGEGSYVNIYPLLDRTGSISPVVDRPLVAPPAPPGGKPEVPPGGRPELPPTGRFELPPSGKPEIPPSVKPEISPIGKPELSPSGKLEMPERPIKMEKPPSPVDRPKSMAERPSMPPPEKPDRPPSFKQEPSGEKPERPEKPAKPGMKPGDTGSLTRRPPRPQPPPPPPPDRKSSSSGEKQPQSVWEKNVPVTSEVGQKQAPLAVAEDDESAPSSQSEPAKVETHL